MATLSYTKAATDSSLNSLMQMTQLTSLTKLTELIELTKLSSLTSLTPLSSLSSLSSLSALTSLQTLTLLSLPSIPIISSTTLIPLKTSQEPKKRSVTVISADIELYKASSTKNYDSDYWHERPEELTKLYAELDAARLEINKMSI